MSIQYYKYKETLRDCILSEIDESAIGFFMNYRFPEKVMKPPIIPQTYAKNVSEPPIAIRIAFLKNYFAAVEETIKTFASISHQTRQKIKDVDKRIDTNAFFPIHEQNILCKTWVDWLLITGSEKDSFFPDPWGEFRIYILCKIVEKVVSELIERFKNKLENLSSEIIQNYPVNQYSMVFYSQLTERLCIDVLLEKACTKIALAADQAEYALIDFLTKKQYIQGEK